MKYLKTILIITVVTVASLLIYISLNREDWTFDKIQENHTSLKQEKFLLNESHYAGLREFLPHYFIETQLKQPIAIREATWETSDSTLITIWFIEKQKQWHPIKQFEWQKGTEF